MTRCCRLQRRNATLTLICVGITSLLFLRWLAHFARRSDSSERGSANDNFINGLKMSVEAKSVEKISEEGEPESSTAVSVVYSSCSPFNFSFSSVIVEPVLPSQESDFTFVFILVMSGVREKLFADRRHAIRSTWLHASPGMRWRHAFVVGSVDNTDGRNVDDEIKREAKLYKDILQFSSIDNYNNLVIKVLSGFRWVLLRVNPRFILKADDDVYIRLPRLTLWLSEFGGDKFYGGFINKDGFFNTEGPLVRRFHEHNALTFDCYPDDRFPQYSAGPFYVLSSDAMTSILNNVRLAKVFPVEDAYVGVLARASDIKPVSITGFQIIKSQLTSIHQCTWNFVVAVGHKFTSPQFHYIQSKLQEADRLNLPRNFLWCLVHESSMTICFPLVFSCLGTIVVALVRVFYMRSQRRY